MDLLKTYKEKHQVAWEAMDSVFRRYFMSRAGCASQECDKKWHQLTGADQRRLLDTIRDNNRFGWQFGLTPSKGIYPNGYTVAEMMERFTATGKPCGPVGRRKGTQERPQQRIVHANVINFSDYRDRFKCAS